MEEALNVHGKRDKIKIKKIFAIKIPHSPSRSFFISLACFLRRRNVEKEKEDV